MAFFPAALEERCKAASTTDLKSTNIRKGCPEEYSA
jgi:hypothetical protein